MVHGSETIVVSDFRHNRVQGGILDWLETSTVLVEEDRITGVEGPEEEHDQKNRREKHLAA
jgi:hypothetical protein